MTIHKMHRTKKYDSVKKAPLCGKQMGFMLYDWTDVNCEECHKLRPKRYPPTVPKVKVKKYT